MLFKYKTINDGGTEADGTIEAINIDIAINSLQRRNLIISSIKPAEDRSLLNRDLQIFGTGISNKDIVILSRQLATLFTAQVSALRIFRLLAGEMENKSLRIKLSEIAEDIQSGTSISAALSKHPKVFSSFYTNMIKAGEESGKLDETFEYLADYLDRSYAVTSKVKNALIYPAFVIFTFFAVMILMLTFVIPKISSIILDSGQEVPIYTQVVIGLSQFTVRYGWFFLIIFALFVILLIYYARTQAGKESFAKLKLQVPYVSSLYKKLYLSRIADNMNTQLISGVPMVKALELTSKVVDNKVYEDLLNDALESVRGGKSLSDSMMPYQKEIPGIMVQMVKVGEETGDLGGILKTLAKFYQREVMQAVDTLVDLIEPVMIVMLGLGVGFLLASVLIPIYNVSSSI
jgi:type IV pilus assembly protein PilC